MDHFSLTVLPRHLVSAIDPTQSRRCHRKRGVNKQLRRLEQSMANRAKQAEQTQRAKLSEVPLNTTASHQDIAASKHVESVTGGVKRKERSGDTQGRRFDEETQAVSERASIVVGGDKDHVSIKTMMGDKDRSSDTKSSR